MNQGTKIEWTHHEGFKGETWNPITGCSKVSPGCANCYAERDWKRLSSNPKLKAYHGRKFTDVSFHPERLEQPLLWNKPRSVFVNSMSDLFHEAVTFEQIAAIFGIMAATPQHRYMILTKRPARMLEFFEWLENETREVDPQFPKRFMLNAILTHETSLEISLDIDKDDQSWPLHNVWLGVTAENQEQANKRIPLLLQAPSAKRFVSIEPMLGQINLDELHYDDYTGSYTVCSLDGIWISGPMDDPSEAQVYGKLDWVIVGGESGPKARPMLPDWVCSIRDQCKEAETPFFFKQWGEFVDYQQADAQAQHSISFQNAPAHGDGVVLFRVGKKQAGSLLDGEEYKEIPGKQPVEKTKL